MAVMVAVLNQIIHCDSLISHDMTYSPGASVNIKMIKRWTNGPAADHSQNPLQPGLAFPSYGCFFMSKQRRKEEGGQRGTVNVSFLPIFWQKEFFPSGTHLLVLDTIKKKAELHHCLFAPAHNFV